MLNWEHVSLRTVQGKVIDGVREGHSPRKMIQGNISGKHLRESDSDFDLKAGARAADAGQIAKCTKEKINKHQTKKKKKRHC